MIVVDASALVAIAQEEPEEVRFTTAILGAASAWIAPVNYLELGVVLRQRGRILSQERLDAWLESLGVALREDVPLGSAALAAYLRFGKGFHPARLNLADCFAYALAKHLDAPLLYKGDDFSQTDVRSAL